MTPDEKTAVRQRLAEIEAANGGRLTPDMVVKDAKRKDSPLHTHFEWDSKKAAEAYWVIQARELITSVRVEVRTENSVVRVVGYVRDPSASSDEQGYVSVRKLRSDQDLAREAIVDAFARAGHHLQAARTLAKALGAEAEIEALVRNVADVKARFEGAQPA